MEFCNLEMQHFQQFFVEQQRKFGNKGDEIMPKKTGSTSPSNTNELEESSVASSSYESDLSKINEQFNSKSKKLLNTYFDDNLIENEPSSSDQIQLECNACSSNFHSLLELHDHNCLSVKRMQSESAPPQVCPISLQQTRNSECRSVPNTLTLPAFCLNFNDSKNCNLEVS